MWWVQFSHPHTSNRPPADFAIDCNTHGSKGATGCDVTPIEFLTSCVQLVYWIGQVSAISANTGISFWQYYRMYVFKFSIYILTIIGMVIGISRYLYFNISYLSISLNFIYYGATLATHKRCNSKATGQITPYLSSHAWLHFEDEGSVGPERHVRHM